MNLPDLLMYLFSGLIFLMMSAVSFLSLLEREYTAARRSLAGAIIMPLPFLALALIDFTYSSHISFILAGLIAVTALIVMMPFPERFRLSKENIAEQYDERDVIFVRNKLVDETDRFSEYYERRPEKLETDNRFRIAPGLLSPESTQADPLMFSSTAASFIACDNLIPLCDGPVSENKTSPEPADLSEYIKGWAKELGAVSVGITPLKQEHLYSMGGRREKYGKPVENTHKFAIAFTVEMNHDSIRRGPKAPAVMESARQYLNAGTIAVQLAAFIRELGYPARAHIDANYEVICPLVGRDAGLGELGRMGILMTPELGPRVRVNVVTTDIPLVADQRQYDGSMTDFCRLCKKCADVCPGRAIPEDDRREDNGVLRWKIDHEKCFTYWCNSGTDCGRCMATCPYSHASNPMHNTVRFFIKHSPVFRRIAAFMDDLLYGRKPKPLKLAKWQKVRYQ